MSQENPLIGNFGIPAFNSIQPDHVKPAITETLRECNEAIDDLEKTLKPSWDGLLAPLEAINRKFYASWGPVSHLFGVKNSQKLREAYNEMLPKIVEFSLNLGQNEVIFEGLKAIENGPQWSSLNVSQQRIIHKKLLEARHQGIELSGQERSRFNEISQRLSQLATEFSNNVLDSTKEFYLVIQDKKDMKDVPANARNLWAQIYNERKDASQAEANGEDGPWGITLDYPSYDPLMKFCQNRQIRQQVYTAYMTRAATGTYDNSERIVEILKLRAEKAQLLGYSSFAELSIASKMAGSVANVDQLLEDLRQASFQVAQQELDALREFAAQEGFEGDFKNWDVSYYSDKLKEKTFSYSEEEVRSYFPMPKVLDGLFKLVENIFMIKVQESADPIETWHEDVKFFDIFDHKGSKIAGFFLDMYSRPANKRGGAWMDTCIDHGYHNGELLLPVAYLVCNSTPPVGKQPSLMSFREVETLFHEFGHGLQHMLTKVKYLDAAGINGVEWDAVELPSQFMENWCYHKPTLTSLTAHVDTGEPLPDNLFQKIKASKNFQSALQMARQVHFSMIDIELHHRFDPDTDDVFAINKAVAKKASPLPVLENDRFLCAFSHIFAGGYSAGYYSYKWAEVLSADAFSKFEEANLEDQTEIQNVGMEFRNSVLALGGSLHPMDVFKQFRGREPRVDALLKHSGLR